MLDPIPELSFDSKRHLYSYKGEWLAHSVSAVTGVDITPQQRAGFEKYKHGPDGWAIRGQTIHDCLDKHLRGEPQIYDDKWSPWVETLLEDDLFKNVNLMASEYSLCLRNSSHSIGGTLDFLISYADDPTFLILGDLKTVSRKNAVSSRKAATEQLGGYLTMINQHWPKLYVSQCVTVVSGPEKCKVIEQEPDECLEAWRGALTRFDALQPDF
jgi:hypothetical protein